MLPELLISKSNPRLYLHSRRRYLINSIPLLSIVALLVGVGVSIMSSFFGISFSVFRLLGWFNGECYAVDTSTSLQVVTPELSDTIIPNTTSYLSSEVVYSAENVENYALQISYAEGSNSLRSESGNTTIADTNSNTPGILAKNTWGYAWGDANTDNATLTYQAMPAYGNAKTIEQGTSDISSTTKKIVFAANLGDDIPTGHYKTNVLLSLVAAPKETVNPFGISTMQEMTSNICNNAVENDTAQLKDTRDNSYYWVTKLKDGNCWMTQNLDYDDPIGTKYTTSNLSSWKGKYDESGAWSNLREYYDPGTAIITESGLEDVNDLASIDTHQLVGNYYSWQSATNGTGSSVSSDGVNTSGSICPINWKLPTATSPSNTSFNHLLTLYAIGNDEAGYNNIQRQPLYFQLAGAVMNGHESQWGESGYYWTSTSSKATGAYFLNFQYTSYGGNPYSVLPANKTDRDRGLPMRCLFAS